MARSNDPDKTPSRERAGDSSPMAGIAEPELDKTLEKARTRSNAARRLHDSAQVEVERRQLALVANEARARAREQSIEQARRTLREDRAALKRLKKERPTLQRKLQDAKDAAAKSGRRARRQEGKYDDAMLRHVVEREKSVDRALHTV